MSADCRSRPAALFAQTTFTQTTAAITARKPRAGMSRSSQQPRATPATRGGCRDGGVLPLACPPCQAPSGAGDGQRRPHGACEISLAVGLAQHAEIDRLAVAGLIDDDVGEAGRQ